MCLLRWTKLANFNSDLFVFNLNEDLLMKTYNIHEAKTNLSKILNEVKEGEVVYIAKAGKKLVELKPVVEKRKRIPWGFLKDKMWVADDWDSEETNREIWKEWEDEELEP